MIRKYKTKLTAWQYLALGYLFIILAGTVLLCLPFATKVGESTGFIDALFTSTSATCVTGLVVYDTNIHWTVFGHLVILCLIQIGGLGFMTFVTLLFQAVGKRMGLHERKVLMLSSGSDNPRSVKIMFRRLLIGAFGFELIGTALLSIRFIGDFGWGKGIYYSIWHSVSAFCNAGFDLMGGVFGGESFVSLTHYATDPLVSLTIATLIVMGGLGFCVWGDFIECKFRLKKLRLHTKIVCLVTAVLLLVPTFLFMLFERNNLDYANYTFGERLLVAFFSSVTPRTAGFNTVNLSALSDGSYLLTLILMFIGGSSGSTAGGIKITTAFVIVMGIASVFRNKRDIEIGNRRIHNALLRQALAIFVSCLMIVLMATLIICVVEEGNDVATFQAVLFETFSAMGTVGLSLSLTPSLSIASRIVLILLMYTGRVGILTIGLAFGEKTDGAKVKKPVDNLLIG